VTLVTPLDPPWKGKEGERRWSGRMDGRKEPKWKGVEGNRTGDENGEGTGVERKRQEGETRKRCVMHVISTN